MAPCKLSGCNGSPTVNFFVRSMNAVLNESYTLASMIILLPHKQICPWLLKEDCTTVSSIFSQLQSAKMMVGFFPPNSKDNFLNRGAAIEAILSPARVLPVNEMAFTLGCCTMASPQRGPVPCTMLSTPSGKPASLQIFAKR